MKILFLTHYFPPEVNAPASRTHEHARRWVADGHRVTVITGVPNHPQGQIFPGYHNRWLQIEEVDGIRVIRTWMYVTPNEGFVKRTLNFILFAIAAVLASFRAERPDVVIATSPQFFCGLAGAVVAFLKRRPFVLELRDLWPESIIALGALENASAIKFLEWIETRLYRRAAAIVVNARAFIDHVVGRGVKRSQIELVYNGVDPSLFHPLPKDEGLLEFHDLADKFVVAYIGTLGMAHGLMTILDAAEKMRHEPNIAFVLIGDGADRERLLAEIEQRGLDNVRMLGLRPRAEIPTWIASCDVMLAMLRDLDIFKTVIPSKIFEYMAQERPVVLAAPKGECRELLDLNKAGFTIEPEDAEALAEVVEKIRKSPEQASSTAKAGRALVDRDFVRDDQARRMLAFLTKTVHPNPRQFRPPEGAKLRIHRRKWPESMHA
jgi:glycosyltransferase involved in cell wall biosynthesis